ncbi:NADH-quinone oxidoreductase subunit L [Marinomonas sp. A79]|uniref:Probable inorganic carbon transporter subunit DabB n=1 Tax=Marinomonas vulgaris TaxID=2823372 RepID=A0ABS5HCJ1_9GAMM|nr:NADH-quinone oxidoreductase subunit L [Marinomonas vulgaris]MBR7889132.1 NADH-quinone oxidoreductase subunit L [Marinomonas vulgaris]
MSLVILSFLPIFIPAAFLLGGWHLGRATTERTPYKAVWLSRGLLMLFLATFPVSYFFADAWQSSNLIRHTSLSQIMLGLVTIMGWVLITFSQNYMAGQANQKRYYRWLMFTLASVAITVTSNHLVTFWLGWLGISLSLHNLLTFYPDRPRAILAAHKKFIVARLAELALLAAFVILYQAHGSLYISDILNTLTLQADAGIRLSTTDHFAAVLIAIAALIKCAQLPFHGWLIQVVESPTPISALLHAGVINLGGYLVLLFAPLVAQSSAAIWLLLLIAGLSTLASALVMTTRISVKVRLAWSTSAQMGLMLMEFALGLYELVLLHLLAHSFYKAYSFLNSGNAINDTLRLSLSGASKPHHSTGHSVQHGNESKPSLKTWLVTIAFCSLVALLVRTVFGLEGALSTWWLFALAMTLLIIQWQASEHAPSLPYILFVSAFLCVAYAALKLFFHILFPITHIGHTAALSLTDLWAMALFSLLFVINALLHYQVHLPAVRRLSIALFAGLYLDEWLTRLVLKVWPVTLPARAKDQHNTSAIDDSATL